jgi:hypothetical protein
LRAPTRSALRASPANVRLWTGPGEPEGGEPDGGDPEAGRQRSSRL